MQSDTYKYTVTNTQVHSQTSDYSDTVPQMHRNVKMLGTHTHTHIHTHTHTHSHTHTHIHTHTHTHTHPHSHTHTHTHISTQTCTRQIHKLHTETLHSGTCEEMYIINTHIHPVNTDTDTHPHPHTHTHTYTPS